MALTLLENTAGTDLGAANPIAVPFGEPVTQTHAYAVERIDQAETGIWECTPGCWRRQIVEQEFCHFLQDRYTFTPGGGEIIRIEAGDVPLLSENSLGVWDAQETVCKSHVIIHRQPARCDGVTRGARGAPRHP